MTAQVAATVPAAPGGASAPQPRTAHGLTFHQVLSALNPLQYLPVVGTIYRAVTGDIIPEPVRRLGSLIVSGLLGGPVGIAINVATIAVERLTGIDLDRTGQALLHGEPVGRAVAEHRPPEPSGVAAATETPLAANGNPQAAGRAQPGSQTTAPWSSAQLAAYGVQTGDAGGRKRGVQGADLLNALELARLHAAHAAYARVAALMA